MLLCVFSSVFYRLCMYMFVFCMFVNGDFQLFCFLKKKCFLLLLLLRRNWNCCCCGFLYGPKDRVCFAILLFVFNVNNQFTRYRLSIFVFINYNNNYNFNVLLIICYHYLIYLYLYFYIYKYLYIYIFVFFSFCCMLYVVLCVCLLCFNKLPYKNSFHNVGLLICLPSSSSSSISGDFACITLI